MVGAVKGIDPKTGFGFDDTKRYVDNAPISDADRQKIFEDNARRSIRRLKTKACDGVAERTADRGVAIGAPYDKAGEKRHRPARSAEDAPLTFGHREVETPGLEPGFWTDLYHRSMRSPGRCFSAAPRRSLSGSMPYLPCLYCLGDDPIANLGASAAGAVLLLDRDAGDGRLWRHAPADELRASRRHRRDLHRHVFLAVMTGLIFARFSRPRARFVFAEPAGDHRCVRASDT